MRVPLSGQSCAERASPLRWLALAAAASGSGGPPALPFKVSEKHFPFDPVRAALDTQYREFLLRLYAKTFDLQFEENSKFDTPLLLEPLQKLLTPLAQHLEEPAEPLLLKGTYKTTGTFSKIDTIVQTPFTHEAVKKRSGVNAETEAEPRNIESIISDILQLKNFQPVPTPFDYHTTEPPVQLMPLVGRLLLHNFRWWRTFKPSLPDLPSKEDYFLFENLMIPNLLLASSVAQGYELRFLLMLIQSMQNKYSSQFYLHFKHFLPAGFQKELSKFRQLVFEKRGEGYFLHPALRKVATEERACEDAFFVDRLYYHLWTERNVSFMQRALRAFKHFEDTKLISYPLLQEIISTCMEDGDALSAHALQKLTKGSKEVRAIEAAANADWPVDVENYKWARRIDVVQFNYAYNELRCRWKTVERQFRAKKCDSEKAELVKTAVFEAFDAFAKETRDRPKLTRFNVHVAAVFLLMRDVLPELRVGEVNYADTIEAFDNSSLSIVQSVFLKTNTVYPINKQFHLWEECLRIDSGWSWKLLKSLANDCTPVNSIKENALKNKQFVKGKPVMQRTDALRKNTDAQHFDNLTHWCFFVRDSEGRPQKPFLPMTPSYYAKYDYLNFGPYQALLHYILVDRTKPIKDMFECAVLTPEALKVIKQRLTLLEKSWRTIEGNMSNPWNQKHFESYYKLNLKQMEKENGFLLALLKHKIFKYFWKVKEGNNPYFEKGWVSYFHWFFAGFDFEFCDETHEKGVFSFEKSKILPR